MPATRGGAAVRGAVRAAVLAAGALGALVVALSLAQSSLIYHPRRYGSAARYYRPREAGTRRLRYSTGEGAQTAFFLPPLDGSAPVSRLWVMAGGNAMLALDWRDTAEAFRRAAGDEGRRAAFVFVDYPGYGSCEGAPHQDTIAESVEAAAGAALAEIGAGEAAAAPPVGLLAHSLGCAVALRFASEGRTEAARLVDRVVLLSPFLSLLATAKYHFSFLPLPAALLRHRYDNAASAERLLAAAPGGGGGGALVDVTIVHGARDRIVPVRMGQRLAAALRADGTGPRGRVRSVSYVEVPRANHNDVFDLAAGSIYDAMAGRPSSSAASAARL